MPHAYHTFLIFSSVVEHLNCFQSLAIVNSAAINMGVQVPLLYPNLHFFGCMPKSGITESYGCVRRAMTEVTPLWMRKAL
jgi:hypothetical protein